MFKKLLLTAGLIAIAAQPIIDATLLSKEFLEGKITSLNPNDGLVTQETLIGYIIKEANNASKTTDEKTVKDSLKKHFPNGFSTITPWIFRFPASIINGALSFGSGALSLTALLAGAGLITHQKEIRHEIFKAKVENFYFSDWVNDWLNPNAIESFITNPDKIGSTTIATAAVFGIGSLVFGWMANKNISNARLESQKRAVINQIIKE